MKLKIWIGLLCLGILLGFITLIRIYTQGFALYAKTDVLVWTLPLATYIFFSLISAGLAFVSSIPIIFGIKRYEIIKKRTMFLELAVLLGSFVCLIMHLGSPLNLFYVIFSPNLASPLWWMGALYSLYLVLLLMAFNQLHNRKSIYGLSVTIFLIAIATSTTLGWLMGMTDARPALNPSFLTLYFPITAFVCGLAALLLAGLLSGYFTGKSADADTNSLYDEIARTLGITSGLVLILLLWRSIIGVGYSADIGFSAFKQMMGTIPYHIELWIGLLVPCVLMLLSGFRGTVWAKVTAASLVLIGMLAGRLEFILSSEIMPLGQMAEHSPDFVNYVPSASEWVVTLFGLSVVLLVYTLGDRFLGLDETPE